MIIKIGTRNSKLAIAYTDQVVHALLQTNFDEQIDVDIKFIKSLGDIKENTPIAELGGKGAFTQTLEDALIKEEIDVAVHSFKDLPKDISDETEISAVLKRNDPRDVFLSRDKIKLRDLKSKSIIGTSSFRREFQIKRLKKDISCKLIRGNVDTRIKKLKEGLYDAIILSSAGIKSLQLEKEITQIFTTDAIIPSAGQGIISIQCRKNHTEITELLNKINDSDTQKCAVAERDVLKVLEGDCETPIGVHALLNNNKIILEAELFSLNGSQRFYEKLIKDKKDFYKIGVEIGKKLKERSKGSYKK